MNHLKKYKPSLLRYLATKCNFGGTGEYCLILLLVLLFSSFSNDYWHKKYPQKIDRYTISIYSMRMKAFRCGDLYVDNDQNIDTTLIQHKVITDSLQILNFISIMQNKNNFMYLEYKRMIDARTSFRYLLNGQLHCICFSSYGLMERNDSVFTTRKIIRKYLLINGRLAYLYRKDSVTNGIIKYFDTTSEFLMDKGK